MAEERIIAVCVGGPLDGQHFSVLSDEQGAPQPLTSRAEVVGALYCPGKELEITVEQQLGFLEESYAEGGEPSTIGIDHDRAVEYTPFEFELGTDEEGNTLYLSGEAIT
jgi:hypothetical protein